MKNYKKGLLTVMVLSAMSLMAAEDKTIRVTTFADEDGENANACSLREAIKTAKLDKSYGGCNVGRTWAADGSAPDRIQLEAGTYKLDSELVVESSIQIYGATPYKYTEKSPITNLYPTIEEVKSIIDGQGKTRLFNTIDRSSGLIIADVRLQNGYSAGDGGAFYVAGPLELYGTQLLNNKAQRDGAVIYSVALGEQKAVMIESSHLQGNIAQGRGSIIAMECTGNLGITNTNFTLANSSVVQNGASNSQSIVDLCGQVSANISNNTIAKNTTSPNGHILSMAHTAQHPLANSALFSLLSNTIVENTARSTVFYDLVGNKTFAYNILAYNNGLSCESATGENFSEEDQAKIGNYGNAFAVTGASRCILPDQSSSIQLKNIDLSNTAMSSVLSSYIAPNITTRWLGLYYPRNNQTATDLVDISGTDCADNDQRGVSRYKDEIGSSSSNINTCDIGAVEVRRLKTKDVTELQNSSYVEHLAKIDAEIEGLKQDIEDGIVPDEELAAYQAELKENEDLRKYIEQYQKYRAIYVNPFDQATPEESLQGNEIRLKLLNQENYDVVVNKIGVGQVNVQNGQWQLDGEVDAALKCEWQPQLKRILMYRTDGKLTAATDKEYCSYTLKDKRTGTQSTSLLSARFINIAPIAASDEYWIRPESNLTVTVNPLENDNDAGDGSTASIGLSKSEFYKNKEGLEIPIRIEKLPAGLSLKAEREGACPQPNERQTCYGGQLTLSANNAFSQSDYIINYNVIDADEMLSNGATITLKNSNKNTNTSSSGGGSTGLWSLVGLLGLVAYRRFGRQAKQ